MTVPPDASAATPARTAARRRLPAALLVVLAITVGLTACGDDGDAPALTGTDAPTTSGPASTTTEAPDGGDASFTVTGDDFYAAPDPLPGDDHGDLIWAEPLDSWWGSPRRAWRVLYRSESLSGDPIAVSGYVIAPPEGAAAGGEPLPVVAWAHGTVGSGDSCAPSRNFDRDTRTTPPSAAVAAQLTAAVDAGAVVVATDYEGLGTAGPHPFLVGESAGRSVLDGVLAAGQLPDADAGTSVLVYGASQGGQAALWAGQVADEWTPELDVLGVVAAAPFSEVDLLLPAASSIPGAEGYLVLGVFGQAAANPDLDPASVLDPAALELAAVVEDGCLAEVQLAFRQLTSDSGRPIADLDALAAPEWQEQLASIKPGTEALDVPVLIVQGDRDTTIPALTTRILVSRMCEAGDLVATVNKPDAGHGDIVAAADAEIRAFVTARLAGEPATSTCAG